MVTTPRNLNNTTKIKPSLEIIPDSRFIVFNGDEHSASTFKLTGRVRLHCPEATSICRPKIKLEGKRRISWVFMSGLSTSVVEDKRIFINQEQPLGSIDSTHKVKAGTIEWPFEFELSPSMPESVEGLADTFIIYHLHASVSRSGWNSKDVTARSHLRIVRTLGAEFAETTRSRVNADVWANKLSYSISIPSDAVIFGTSITADVELSPIKKGIRLGRVEMKLIETVVKRISQNEYTEARGDKAKSEECEVAKEQMDFPESTKITYDEEDAENPVMADEMYRFQATLPLPKSLHRCRQDVDSHSINISHRFKLMVNIHNPEGHISQLVCRLPVKLFISPNLPIGDDSHEVLPVAVSDSALNQAETTMVAPPKYGEHQLDQLFSDIDVNGYLSRAGSGPTTPAGFLAQSRRGSVENLNSLNGLTLASVANGETHESATPAALHSRLTDLQVSDIVDDQGQATYNTNSGTITPDEQGSFNSGNRINSSASLAQSVLNSASSSRRTSAEDAAQTGNQDYNLHKLSRVPTYNTAMRTPLSTASRDGPPSYVDATSRPPSPQRPRLSHAGSSGTSQDAAVSPSRSGMSDEDVRLRMLRART